MVKVVVAKHLKAGTETFQSLVPVWIGKAVSYVTKGAPGGAAPTKHSQMVVDWFGNLSAQQYATLKANLTKMQSVIAHKETSIRIVDAPAIRNDRAFYAQVRGHYNPMRPVLSVEVADQWPTSNHDTKVNTLFHELSHRIIPTIDLGRQQGYPEMMYGIANAQSLAQSNPDDALRNAENYGYFIALCNKLANQEP